MTEPDCDKCFGEKTEDCPEDCLNSHVRYINSEGKTIMNPRTQMMFRNLLLFRSIQDLKFHEETGNLEYIIISGGKLEIHLDDGNHHIHDFRSSASKE